MIKRSTDVSVVTGQLASWALILLLSDFAEVITTPSLWIIVVIGLTLAIVGAYTLGSKTYSSLTRPLETNVFTQKGLYRYIRHPIYIGMLTAGLAFLLSRLTIQVGLAFLLLFLFTNIRADLEEGLLEERHPEYSAYKAQTKRYIPFIY